MAFRRRSKTGLQLVSGTDRILNVRTGENLYTSGLLTRNLFSAVYCEDETRNWKLALRAKRKNPYLDFGGNLDLVRLDYEVDTPDVVFGSSGNTRRFYTGGIMPQGIVFNETRPPTQSELVAYVGGYSSAELISLGTTAIDRCRPHKSQVQAIVALKELYSEGIPKIIEKIPSKKKLGVLSAAGSNYLNVKFGWVPFVSEVRGAMEAIVDFDDRWNKICSSYDRILHRRYDFPPSSQVVENFVDDNLAPWPTLTVYHWSYGPRTRYRYREQRVWFEGDFVMPPMPDSPVKEAAAKARTMFGLKLTPSTVWDCLPWSWASDYFLNFGDVFGAWDLLFDGIVLTRAYVMATSGDHLHVTHRDLKAKGYGAVPGMISGKRSVTRKQRLHASSFGFGVRQEDLSGDQIAILSALGLSRL